MNTIQIIIIIVIITIVIIITIVVIITIVIANAMKLFYHKVQV